MQKSVSFDPSVKVSTIETAVAPTSTTATTTPLTTVNPVSVSIPLTPTPERTAVSQSQQSQSTGTHDVQSSSASTNSARGFNFSVPSASTTSTTSPSQLASLLLKSQSTLRSVGNVPVSASRATTSGNSSQELSQGQVSSATANLQQPITTQGTTMNFRKLCDVLDNCVADLLVQEELFEAKAKEVNLRDRVLALNGEKINQLQYATDRLKRDHARIESGLNFVKAQQLELDNAVGHLEQSLFGTTPLEDPSRVCLYNMAAKVDSQLMGIGGDLKDVIEQINEKNKREETMLYNDPVVDILKILNKHTDTLLWVEDSCSKLQTDLSDIREDHIKLKKDYVASMREFTK